MGRFFCQMGHVLIMLYLPHEHWLCRKIGLISRLNIMQMAPAIGWTSNIRFDNRYINCLSDEEIHGVDSCGRSVGISKLKKTFANFFSVWVKPAGPSMTFCLLPCMAQVGAVWPIWRRDPLDEPLYLSQQGFFRIVVLFKKYHWRHKNASI